MSQEKQKENKPIFVEEGQEANKDAECLVVLSDPSLPQLKISGIFDSRVLRLETGYCVDIHSEDYLEGLAAELSDVLRSQGVPRATIIATGQASLLAQAMFLHRKKQFRKLVLLGGHARQPLSRLAKLIDRIDSLSPFGLPLSVPGDDFDSRPYLHKIDCPVLLLDSYTYGTCAKSLKERLPCAWRKIVKKEDALSFSEYIESFLSVQARCPQKHMTKKASGA